MCVTTDNADLIKPTLTPSFQKVRYEPSQWMRYDLQVLTDVSCSRLEIWQLLAELDDLLEFFVITDLNKALIKYVLALCVTLDPR